MRRRSLALALVFVLMELPGAADPQARQPKTRASKEGILDVVVDDDTGQRLSDAVVSVPGYRSTTGLGGSCRFGLPPGRYSVSVRKTGYGARTARVYLRPEETTTAHVRLRKVPRVRR